jgi:hypothetical protein
MRGHTRFGMRARRLTSVRTFFRESCTSNLGLVMEVFVGMVWNPLRSDALLQRNLGVSPVDQDVARRID